MKIKLSTIAIAIALLTGCNTPPSRIAPAHAEPTVKESGMSCEQLSRYKQALDSRIVSERAALDSAAITDAAIVGGSIIILPIGLIGLAFTGTGDLPGRYAEGLGKQRAIQELLIDKGC